MVGDASRFVAAAASIPLLLAAHAWRRAQNGPAAVVELHVTRVADVADRALLARRVARMAHDPTLSALLLRIEGPPGGLGGHPRSARGDRQAAPRRPAGVRVGRVAGQRGDVVGERL